MNNKWTPILATPLTLVAVAGFGLAVFRVGNQMGYPRWIAVVAGLLAATSAWNSCRGRYDRLTARQRQGGSAPLADLGRLLARQELLLLLVLAAALPGYALAAALLPADPLTALGLIEPRQAAGADPVSWLLRELWRWLGGLLLGTAASHVLGGLLFPDHPFEPFSRGRRLKRFAEANRAADAARPDEDPGLSWG